MTSNQMTIMESIIQKLIYRPARAHDNYGDLSADRRGEDEDRWDHLGGREAGRPDYG